MENLIKICKDIYRYPRSITGIGVERTLEYIKKIIPIEIKMVKSGSKVFDWTIPEEWNINDAYVIDLSSGKKIIDFKKHNLHLVSYSKPINMILDFEKLKKKLYYLKDKPNAIPYVTSYYNKDWGFCLTFNDYKKINKESKFKVFIDSNFNSDGNLTFGEYLLKGKVKKEILLSTYVCHPQMVNNELSGIAVLTGIAKQLRKKENYYSYRFLLIPETIGAISYISKNLNSLKEKVVGGYVITCVGDERDWGIISSRYGNNISEKIAETVLNSEKINFTKYSWLERGSDERQFCSPGVDLPISSITRSKYDEYPEYHTSLDDFNLTTNIGLNQSLKIYLKCIDFFEKNIHYPITKFLCEPQLGKRNLYDSISFNTSKNYTSDLSNFISYCDGTNSILDISKLCKLDFYESYQIYLTLQKNQLIK